MLKNRLCEAYSCGSGAVQGYKQAARWFGLSANQGNATAQTPTQFPSVSTATLEKYAEDV